MIFTIIFITFSRVEFSIVSVYIRVSSLHKYTYLKKNKGFGQLRISRFITIERFPNNSAKYSHSFLSQLIVGCQAKTFPGDEKKKNVRV